VPKTWRFPPALPGPPELDVWADALGVSPFLTRLLWQRGLGSLIDMDRFLTPGLRHLDHPHACPGLEQAAAVLAEGLTAGKRFAVWGDYDVDGTTSTALVKEFMATTSPAG
jgi:single-stranded-DNA-specific exonuclease